jgi:hypothetical protein
MKLRLYSFGGLGFADRGGSFIESFPLFGYDLDDYDELFVERLDLLLKVREKEVVNWDGGRFRPPIRNRRVNPRAEQEELPVWVAVGGSPESAARVAQLGLPMALAIIRGTNRRADQYGGSAENRVHFALEIIEALHGIWERNRIALAVSPGGEIGSAELMRERFRDNRELAYPDPLTFYAGGAKGYIDNLP